MSTGRDDKKCENTERDWALTVHDLGGEEDNLSITQFPLYRNISWHFVTSNLSTWGLKRYRNSMLDLLLDSRLFLNDH